MDQGRDREGFTVEERHRQISSLQATIVNSETKASQAYAERDRLLEDLERCKAERDEFRHLCGQHDPQGIDHLIEAEGAWAEHGRALEALREAAEAFDLIAAPDELVEQNAGFAPAALRFRQAQAEVGARQARALLPRGYEG